MYNQSSHVNCGFLPVCIYIIPGDELGNLASVISTKKIEIWTNQMKVIQRLMNTQEQLAKLC